ncbi:hypothetical protein USDA257_c29040 [Sinorhizobium fredii USDA 257]|uniref:Uncharacterized protein n=2 Tax=Rhizobium fredii TaxID=380 RepID=I3X6G9_SINF2|nr:hypothetical protein USDA257_c29040 [Sinorhizobium fredii USDA 257]
MSDGDVESALGVACELLEMAQEGIIRLIIREWLEEYGFLPIYDLDDGSETKGSA